jgi:hypothetical protein
MLTFKCLRNPSNSYSPSTVATNMNLEGPDITQEQRFDSSRRHQWLTSLRYQLLGRTTSPNHPAIINQSTNCHPRARADTETTTV